MAMSGFSLHPRLAADCIDLGSLGLCRLLLMNDRRYPWCILVPERPDLREVFELSDQDQQTLTRESSRVARFLSSHFAADKINLAALGNLVPQLHIHVVARFDGDPAWPGPVWGVGEPVPYAAEQRQVVIQALRQAFEL